MTWIPVACFRSLGKFRRLDRGRSHRPQKSAVAIRQTGNEMTFNWYLVAIAVVFFFEQNKYFGWNATPKSDAELIADGITFLLLALSVKID
jgi:hypothetical protein